MNKDLEILLSIKKKSEASNAKKKQYEKLLLEELNTNGLTEDALLSIESGFGFLGAKPIVLYIKQSKNYEAQLIDKILKYGNFKNNTKGITFKYLISLFAEIINEKDFCNDFIKYLLLIIPKYAYNKEKQLFGDTDKIIEKYLFKELKKDIYIPDIEELCLSEKELIKIKQFFTSVLNISTFDSKYDNVKQILLKKLRISNVYPEILTTEQENNAIKKSNKKQGKVANLKEENEKLKLKISEKINENNTLMEYLNQNKDTITKLEQKLKDFEKELNKNKNVIEIFEANAQTSKKEMLNSLGAKLKTEFLDFQNALNVPMTVDLGENLRIQLNTVFKILEKNGITIIEKVKVEKEEL